MNRRGFLKTGLTTGALASGWIAAAESPHVACNQYTWTVYYKREGKDFNADLDAGLAAVAEAGIDGFEPGLARPDDATKLIPLLKKHGLQMRSVYVGTVLHEKEKVEQNIFNVVAIAKEAKKAGTTIVVTNPSPIRWGGTEYKSDEQLEVQAEALNELGRRLSGMDIKLAYHNHDIEMRMAAREFHHMMVGTDPEVVGLCLDLHWVYRGAGNSNVAAFDILKMYLERIVELHIRQSVDGIWAEVFTSEGDVHWQRAAEFLKHGNLSPHLVLEQAVEKGTPFTMDAVTAHRKSTDAVKRLFS